MKIIELVQSSRVANADLFGEIPDQKIARLLSAVLGEVSKQLATAEDGRVAIAGFGSFKSKQVEREKDGKKITITRVLFQPAKPGDQKVAKVKTGKKKNKQLPAA